MLRTVKPATTPSSYPAASSRSSKRETKLQSESTVLLLATGRSSAASRAGWACFALLSLVGLGQLLIGVDPQDEGQLLTYPWLIAHGVMPYQHIWMSYPPGTFVILAALLKLGLPGLVAERGLSVVARLFFVLVLNRALTGSWRRFSWVGTPAAFGLLFLSSGARAYPWVVGMPVFLLGLLLSKDRPRLAAALFFLAGLFRFEFALAGCVALISLALLERRDGTATRGPLSLLHHCEAGIALALATGAFHLALNTLTGGQALRDIFLDPVFVVDPAHRLPLFPPYFSPAGWPLELVAVGGPFLMVALGLSIRRPYVVATNLGVLTLLPQFFQRADWQHLFAVAAISVPWMVVGLIDLLEVASEGQERGRSVARLSRASLALIGLTVGAWYSIVVLSYGLYLSPLSPVSTESIFHHWSKHVVQAGASTIIASSPVEARNDEQVATYLRQHGGAAQQVFVAPRTLRYDIYNQTVLYFVLGLHPAGRYLEMLPGLEKQAAVQREIIAGLRHCRWIVLWKGGFSYEPNSSVVPGSALLERYVHTHYRPALENATYQVLLSKHV